MFDKIEIDMGIYKEVVVECGLSLSKKIVQNGQIVMLITPTKNYFKAVPIKLVKPERLFENIQFARSYLERSVK